MKDETSIREHLSHKMTSRIMNARIAANKIRLVLVDYGRETRIDVYDDIIKIDDIESILNELSKKYSIAKTS